MEPDVDSVRHLDNTSPLDIAHPKYLILSDSLFRPSLSNNMTYVVICGLRKVNKKCPIKREYPMWHNLCVIFLLKPHVVVVQNIQFRPKESLPLTGSSLNSDILGCSRILYNHVTIQPPIGLIAEEIRVSCQMFPCSNFYISLRWSLAISIRLIK